MMKIIGHRGQIDQLCKKHTMKTILVPTDFSENARHALSYAVEIARRKKAEILLLHTYQVPYDFEIQLPGIIEEMEKKSAIELSAEKARIESTLQASGTGVRTFSTMGDVVEATLELAEAEKVDMIVMGTQGASGLKRVFIGSNTASLINKATCPVLAVPASTPIASIDKIAYSTDYRQEDIGTIEKVVSLAAMFDATVSILHVNESDSFTEDLRFRGYRDLIKEKIPYSKLSFHKLLADSVYEGVENFIKTEHPSILVTATYRRSLLSSILEPSVTKRMAYYTEVPLLAVNVS
jgi:nucleotide-binding universal stress UspA family protein